MLQLRVVACTMLISMHCLLMFPSSISKSDDMIMGLFYCYLHPLPGALTFPARPNRTVDFGKYQSMA